jgi:thiamine biosynthesis lipoprotein
MIDELQQVTFQALGTTATIIVTDATRLPAAEHVLRLETAAIDHACSRFRPDSEISLLKDGSEYVRALSPLLTDAIAAALRAAAATDGLVDPTVGAAVRELGYDRDFAALPANRTDPPPAPRPAPGWQRIQLDTTRRELRIPRDLEIDLGATGKALAADRIAARAAAYARCGVLVNLGGDLAVGGKPPTGGWQVAIADDHTAARETVVTILGGGLATSSILRRQWRRAGRLLHHIIDPRTGEPAVRVWRTVSVAAASCVDANAASTAAIVLGDAAPSWLAGRHLPARLVSLSGKTTTVADWPSEVGQP